MSKGYHKIGLAIGMVVVMAIGIGAKDPCTREYKRGVIEGRRQMLCEWTEFIKDQTIDDYEFNMRMIKEYPKRSVRYARSAEQAKQRVKTYTRLLKRCEGKHE